MSNKHSKKCMYIHRKKYFYLLYYFVMIIIFCEKVKGAGKRKRRRCRKHGQQKLNDLPWMCIQSREKSCLVPWHWHGSTSIIISYYSIIIISSYSSSSAATSPLLLLSLTSPTIFFTIFCFLRRTSLMAL